MCSPAVGLLPRITRTMSPGFAPMALTAGSLLLICGSWYGCTRYCSRSFLASCSGRISCFGTMSCSKMSNAGNVLGRSSICFLAAPCLTAWVYLPSVTSSPLSISCSFMYFCMSLIAAMPTVVSPGKHQIMAFSLSLGMFMR